jgi:hypothetical protein
MKKTFSISKSTAEQLFEHAQKNNTTMSTVVEVALTLYLNVYDSTMQTAKKTLAAANKDIPDNQLSIYNVK